MYFSKTTNPEIWSLLYILTLSFLYFSHTRLFLRWIFDHRVEVCFFFHAELFRLARWGGCNLFQWPTLLLPFRRYPPYLLLAVRQFGFRGRRIETSPTWLRVSGSIAVLMACGSGSQSFPEKAIMDTRSCPNGSCSTSQCTSFILWPSCSKMPSSWVPKMTQCSWKVTEWLLLTCPIPHWKERWGRNNYSLIIRSVLILFSSRAFFSFIRSYAS